jgi:hypothetical protein
MQVVSWRSSRRSSRREFQGEFKESSRSTYQKNEMLLFYISKREERKQEHAHLGIEPHAKGQTKGVPPPSETLAREAGNLALSGFARRRAREYRSVGSNLGDSDFIRVVGRTFCVPPFRSSPQNLLTSARL